MMINPINRIMTNNAAYSAMNASDSLMRLSFKGGNPNMLMSAEKNLTLRMLNDSLMYKASLLKEETDEKLAKEKIKRSFSIFA